MTTEPFDVCVIGSANLDIVVRTPRIPLPGETLLGSELAHFAGGKGLNQAVAAARSGAHTAFVGALGTDSAGATLRAVLADNQIDHAGVADVEELTGQAIITVDDAGENTIIVIAGANDHVTADRLAPSAVVLAQLEVPLDVVEDTFRRVRSDGATTVLNPAPATELPDRLLANCDYVIPNEHELELTGGVERALDAGCRAVIVTRGGRGVEIITAEGTRHVPPFSVDPIDSVGAGDAFCGSFAARIAAGDDIDQAVRWAAAAGALATTIPGAVPGQPTAVAVRELLAQQLNPR